MGVFVRTAVAGILGISLLLPTKASADINTPPNRVSAELWKIYRETAMFSVEGSQRNLRWTTSPGYFVKGNPSSVDTDTLNKVLFSIGEHCDNIKPGRSTQEPQEGVIFNFIRPTDFKTVIKDTPDDVKDSYLYWTYFLNRGITKTDIVISTEITDRLYRDYLIRVRALQAFGFNNLVDNSNYNLFARSYRYENSGTVTKQDRELLGFYCSTYVRAWETELQTQQLINSIDSSLANSAPNFENRSKVTVTNFGATVEIHPRGDLVLGNKVSQILLQVTDRAGVVVKNEDIDLSTDAYSIRTINLTGLEKKTSYNAVIYNRNSAGLGFPQRISFRTEEVTSSGPADPKSATDASLEAIDSFNAALDSYKLGLQAKSDCLKAFQSTNSLVRRILGLVSGTSICTSQDTVVGNAYKTLLSLQPSTTSVKDPLVLIDRLNDLTDEFNLFAEVMDEGTVFAEEISDSAEDLFEVESRIREIEEFASTLDIVIERLPSKIKNQLVSKTELVDYADIYSEYESTRDDFYEALSQFSGLTYVDIDALEDLESSIDLALRFLPETESMRIALNTALKVVPNFYCKKGKLVSLPTKGKCSTGFIKVKINKG